MPEAIKSRYVFQPAPSGESALRLFCFHPAGHGAAMYRDWGKLLTPRIEVCAVRLPGRENVFKEPRLESFTALVKWVTETIRPFLDRPYAVFGHSMGAWVAYEVARRLQTAPGVKATHVFVSGRHAPHTDEGSMQHLLPDTELIADIQRQYEGVPMAVTAEPALLKMMLPILRSDLTALGEYRHTSEPRLDAPLTCYAGAEDSQVGDAELQPWGSLTSRRFEIERFPGGHFYISGASRTSLLRHIEIALGMLRPITAERSFTDV